MARIPDEVLDAFFRGPRVPPLDFVLKETVDIIEGPHAGRGGSVITPTTLVPEPVYTVELGDTGEDVDVPQRWIRRYRP